MTASRTTRTRRAGRRRSRRAVPFALLAALLFAGAAGAQDAAPAQPEQEPPPAQVRVAHLSPNAPAVDVALYPLLDEDADGDGETDRGDALQPDPLTGLAYGDATDFLEVPAGDYAVVVSADGSSVLEGEVDLAADTFTTVAAIGLVLPDEVQQEAEAEEGGFLGFVRNLFGDGGAERDALELQLLVLEDDLYRAVAEGETLVRVVHASPGTEEIDLAVMGEEGVLVRGVEFGEASPYRGTTASVDGLELRIEGSRAATVDLSESELTVGGFNTVVLIGTSLEEAPIEVLVLGDAPRTPPAAAGDTTPSDAGDASAAQETGEAADAAAGTAATAEQEETAQEETAQEETAQEETAQEETEGDAAQEGEQEGEPEGEQEEGTAQEGEAAATADAPTLDALVAEQDDLGTLATALEQSGFMQTLAGPETYTLFAPTDAAFEALSQEQLDALLADTETLNAVLSNHLVQGEVLSDALASEGEVTTAQGSALVVPGDGTIGDATVVETDIRGANGVIHKIDALLIPQGVELPAPEGEGN